MMQDEIKLGDWQRSGHTRGINADYHVASACNCKLAFVARGSRAMPVSAHGGGARLAAREESGRSWDFFRTTQAPNGYIQGGDRKGHDAGCGTASRAPRQSRIL